MTLPIPTEEVEQGVFVQWLEIKGYTFTAIPNSTYTPSYQQMNKNTRMGLRPGFPDMVIIADFVFMAVELKRRDGGNKGTPAQRKWIADLTSAGIPAKICNGAEEAIEFVNSTLKAKS